MIDNQELAQAGLVLLSVAIKLNQSWQILNLFHGNCILLEISPLKFSFASSLNILTPPMNSVKIYGRSETCARKLCTCTMGTQICGNVLCS